MYDMTQPLLSICLVRNDCAMRTSNPKPSKVTTIVDGEHAQELFRTSRCLPFRRSTMLSCVISFASELILGGGFAFGGHGVADVEPQSR